MWWLTGSDRWLTPHANGNDVRGSNDGTDAWRAPLATTLSGDAAVSEPVVNIPISPSAQTVDATRDGPSRNLSIRHDLAEARIAYHLLQPQSSWRGGLVLWRGETPSAAFGRPDNQLNDDV